MTLPAPDRPSAHPPVTIDAGSLTRCRHRLYLDTAYGSLLRGMKEDAGVVQRREAAAAHREVIRDEMAARGAVVVPTDMSRTARIEATVAACHSGASMVWGAVFAEDDVDGRRGRCDMLMADPAGGYAPVLVVNHKVTDPGSGAITSPLGVWDPRADATRKVRSQLRDQLALVHAHRLLGAAGLAGASAVGGVIGFGADCMLVHDLAAVAGEYDERFADRLAVAQGRALTVPSRVGECRSCRWWTDCRGQLEAAHDVSLVAPGGRADALRAAGIRTVDELALWTGGVPENWPHGDFAEAIVLARAWLTKVPLVRRRDEVAVQRADVEVDVDMESYQEHGAYMWGTLLDRRDGTDPEYRAFLTWEPVPTLDEARSFAEFWGWLMGRRADAHAAGQTFAAYCYSRSAEDKWLLDSARRFDGMPGVPTEVEIHEFIDGPEWVDMYVAVSENFVCPSGKGLKKVAPVAGFNWRDDEAGGEASMGWYREAVGYDGESDLSQRTRLLEYNEDDVQATRALRVWMADRATAEIPTADDLRVSVA
ncbi:TM0106 family RecB-like putative nuclease [Actinomycetes bacterium M1A6_2h]